jgi:hypothetical protein
MNVDKIDTNPFFVSVNNLRPYQHLKLAPYGLEVKIEEGRDVNVRVPQQCNGKKMIPLHEAIQIQNWK